VNHEGRCLSPDTRTAWCDKAGGNPTGCPGYFRGDPDRLI